MTSSSPLERVTRCESSPMNRSHASCSTTDSMGSKMGIAPPRPHHGDLWRREQGSKVSGLGAWGAFPQLVGMIVDAEVERMANGA